MAKNNIPVTITASDVEDKTLLVRALRSMSDRLAVVENAHDTLQTQVAAIPVQPTPDQVKASLESNGNHPLNIQNLHGVAGEPQLAKLPIIPKPSGLALQQLENGHIFAVQNGAAYQVWMVLGGNPNTLTQLI